jgi:acyl carrier protein
MLQSLYISEIIRSFLKGNLAVHAGDFVLKDDDNIFELGFVDSSFAMQLVVFIEENFHITITDEDLEIANFSSIARMRALVDSKKAAR